MQMTYEDYANLAAEMNILFRYIDDDLVEKVPQKIIEFFQDIASPTFRSKIDPRFPLDEQYLLPSTELMLTLLYRQYWCTEEEREELDRMIIEHQTIEKSLCKIILHRVIFKPKIQINFSKTLIYHFQSYLKIRILLLN